MTGAGPVRRWARALGLALLLSAGSVPVLAASPDIDDFLQQVQTAARTLDFAGVYVYQQGAVIQSTRLAHVVDGTGERERLEALDGEPRECLRQNDIQRCLYPDRKLVVAQPARSDHFPGLLLGDGRSLGKRYEWKPSSRAYRVAGRRCTVSELLARDRLRYSYRVCTDQKTHLLLKSQTLDPRGHIVDQVAFGSIRLGTDVPTNALDAKWDTHGWKQETESGTPTDLQAKGWRFSPPAGFAPVVQLSRKIGPNHGVDQLVLSDGLAAISIFVETFDPKRDQNVKQGGMRQGALNIYRLRLASYWLTAVGEVPAQTVRDVAHAVQYVPKAAH
ncbi:MAG: siderophore-interacting protein [Castellaniella sp.]|uniref:MucB/RseB C-terminal domain-containing protein n=1 Tax=Castellaniella sp. TaxID=1955812 RepID=UPI0012056FEA|nr:MucB/RseB C-terminal domain-containing protein [Castellaniella sp.]TAN30258.1 MAG: siderophore-interacting protein [Castellaniella sp.]